jgi:hypothetical protein
MPCRVWLTVRKASFGNGMLSAFQCIVGRLDFDMMCLPMFSIFAIYDYNTVPNDATNLDTSIIEEEAIDRFSSNFLEALRVLP